MYILSVFRVLCHESIIKNTGFIGAHYVCILSFLVDRLQEKYVSSMFACFYVETQTLKASTGTYDLLQNIMCDQVNKNDCAVTVKYIKYMEENLFVNQYLLNGI